MTCRIASLTASLFAIAVLTACPSDNPPASDGTESGTGLTSMTTTSTTTTTTTDVVDDSTTESPMETTTDTPTSTDETTGPSCPADVECCEDRECDDGLFCNGPEACVEGACVPGDPPDCGRSTECSTVECSDERGACVVTADNSLCKGCGETCDDKRGCGIWCTPAQCQGGQPFQCGDCIDNDGDCLIDTHDPDCWGPCDNNETGWNGNVPGQQSNNPCNIMDCYFDGNSGAGNDECYWAQTCDPLAPSYCTYNPNYNLPGNPPDCGTLQMQQTQQCEDYCAPLTPNGCDCFGCCEVHLDDMTTVTVYLGTFQQPFSQDIYTCNLDVVEDPELCHPCTQVQSCFNPCQQCEICIGQTELPEDCTEQVCPAGLQLCGQAGQDPCPNDFACITGCCVPEPQ